MYNAIRRPRAEVSRGEPPNRGGGGGVAHVVGRPPGGCYHSGNTRGEEQGFIKERILSLSDGPV